MQIFLLEDDSSLQKEIALKLTKEGHSIACSETVASAYEVIQKKFDMVILDLNLPDGSGMDICLELRKSPASPHIVKRRGNGYCDGLRNGSG